jgi:hypothetical protein
VDPRDDFRPSPHVQQLRYQRKENRGGGERIRVQARSHLVDLRRNRNRRPLRGLSYAQEFLGNLNVIEEPIVRKVGANVKAFMRVAFTPDYQRLGMPNGLTADMIDVFKKRLYDIVAVTENRDNADVETQTQTQMQMQMQTQTQKRKLKLVYRSVDNVSTVVPIRGFKQYVDL